MPAFLNFRRGDTVELIRKASFIALVFAVAWLAATNSLDGRHRGEQIDGLKTEVDALRAAVRTMAGQGAALPSTLPLVITIPADPASGAPERVIVIPGSGPGPAVNITTTTATQPPTTTTTTARPSTTTSSTTTSTTACSSPVTTPVTQLRCPPL